MVELDNYKLLFGAHAVAAAKAYPAAPPVLDRLSRHRMLAVLDGGGNGGDPAAPEAFTATYGAEFAAVRPVFKRLGVRPLPRRGYQTAVPRLSSEPRLVRALSHLQTVSTKRLAVALALPPELARGALLTLPRSSADARALGLVFDRATTAGRRPRAELAAALLQCEKLEDVWRKLEQALPPSRWRKRPGPGTRAFSRWRRCRRCGR